MQNQPFSVGSCDREYERQTDRYDKQRGTETLAQIDTNNNK